MYGENRSGKCGKENIQINRTSYQVYSQEGLFYPRGKPYPPAGLWRAIIFDISNRGRVLRQPARWAITGGEWIPIRIITRRLLRWATLSSTTPALQLYLIQLAVGIPGTSPVGESRAGSCSHSNLNVYISIKTSTRSVYVIPMGNIEINWACSEFPWLLYPWRASYMLDFGCVGNYVATHIEF